MKLLFYLAIVLIGQNSLAQVSDNQTQATGTVRFVFRNLINGKPVALFDSTYINSFGESFQLTKFKYYVTNISVSDGRKSFRVKQNYHLINQQIDSSLTFTMDVPARHYEAIHFLLGVDSAANESGAQTGSLDPLNDMFWTWQSGYVMFKMEGTSPQSTVTNNKIEYHLGGYKGENSIVDSIKLLMVNLNIRAGKTTTIIINADINIFWNAITPIRITETALCNTPGELAKQMAANCRQMFSIAEVINEK